MLLGAGGQRLDGGAEHLVGQDAAGPEGLGALDGHSGRVLVADAGHQELVVLAGPALRVGDGVSHKNVVVTDVPVVFGKGAGALRAVGLEQVEAHHHPGQR